MFAIERALKEATAEERLAAHKEQSQPLLNSYYSWLRQQKSRPMPKKPFRHRDRLQPEPVGEADGVYEGRET